MSKIPLQINKELVLNLIAGIGLLVVFVINIVLIGNALVTTYKNRPAPLSRQAIDTKTIDEAIKIINP